MDGQPLGLPPEASAPRRPGADDARQGREQAVEHGPGTTRSTSHPLILQSVVHSFRATSRRTVQLGRDPTAGSGVCSVTGAAAPGCLLTGTSQAIGKRFCARIVGINVTPEFVPKHNSGLSGNRGRRPDDAVRLEIGEEEGSPRLHRVTCVELTAVIAGGARGGSVSGSGSRLSSCRVRGRSSGFAGAARSETSGSSWCCLDSVVARETVPKPSRVGERMPRTPAGDLMHDRLGPKRLTRLPRARLLALATLTSGLLVASCGGSSHARGRRPGAARPPRPRSRPWPRAPPPPCGRAVRRGVVRHGFVLRAGPLLLPAAVPGRVWHPAVAGQGDRRPWRDSDGPCPLSH